ncbi:MBL fold metallo-hydrolase [Microbacterium sp. NIBRBAC000506063]|uniref:MBL fold metallo-hydrolase n=1 Tax=Microbacterium sp. NIBRBAC000506063 TaxID=2734618 RepID=UPI001BB4B857|nr:MBL fold metallo-hydrolase [Microbacterium sp. NIBRBAC000506063]QTV79637.1 MBL fold metallo-hydrolase [Microbacterium sp. NIBRBAC000506063]
MKITKHEHAALRLEAHGRTLIIDPGSFTAPLENVENLAGIVLTHQHPDHWSAEHLERLLADAPGTPIFAPAGVVAAAEGFPITEVAAGDGLHVKGFSLRFFGGTHEVIHSSIPSIDNVGVLVDDSFYYPGDSYAVPGVEVDILAAPLGAPWLRIGDAIDFVLAVAPRHAFATHDMTLSGLGKGMHRQRLEWATAQAEGTFHVLEPGDSLEV